MNLNLKYSPQQKKVYNHNALIRFVELYFEAILIGFRNLYRKISAVLQCVVRRSAMGYGYIFNTQKCEF